MPACALAGSVWAQPTLWASIGSTRGAATSRSPGAVVIDVRGDLDSEKIAHTVRQRIVESASSDHVLLRMDGDRWRLDVVWMIALAMRDSPAPVSVYLDGSGDGVVGLGQLLLAAIADRSWIAPGTVVRSGPGSDVGHLASEQTPWERIEREMSGLMWVAMEHRGLDPAVGEAMLRGSSSLWLIGPPGAGASLSLEPPPERDAVVLIDAAPDGTVKAELSWEVATELGFVDGSANSVRRLLAREGHAGRPETSVVRSGLDEARGQALARLAEADRLIHHAEAVLDRTARPPDERVVPRSAYHQAAREVSGLVAAARGELARAEALFSEYPELLAMPAPEGTSVGRTSRTNATDWRWSFINRRRALDRLAERAREYASR